MNKYKNYREEFINNLILSARNNILYNQIITKQNNKLILDKFNLNYNQNNNLNYNQISKSKRKHFHYTHYTLYPFYYNSSIIQP